MIRITRKILATQVIFAVLLIANSNVAFGAGAAASASTGAAGASAGAAASSLLSTVKALAKTHGTLAQEHITAHWQKYGALVIIPLYIVATNDKLSDAQIAAKRAKNKAATTRATKGISVGDAASQLADSATAAAKTALTDAEKVATEALQKAETAVVNTAKAALAEAQKDAGLVSAWWKQSYAKQAKIFVQWRVLGNLEQAPRTVIDVQGKVQYNAQGHPMLTDFVKARGLVAKHVLTDRIMKLRCLLGGCF